MSSAQLPAADVVLDLVFDQGLFFLELVNLGTAPALDVSCEFDPQLIGIDGREISSLPLFRNVPFLMAGRRIGTLLDTSVAYFASGQPTEIAVTVTYHDRDRTPRKTTIQHDLEIYRDLAYVER